MKNIKNLKLLFLIIFLFDASNGFSQLNADFNFSQNRRCAPAIVTFVNNSTQGSGIQYIWNFGNGIKINSDNPELIEAYTEAGEYLVTLEVIQGTDTATAEKVIIIYQEPYAEFTFTPEYICPGDFVQFNITDTSDIAELIWYFGDGASSTEINPQHQYNIKGDVVPRLYLGCNKQFTYDTLHISNVFAQFEIQNPKSIYCENEIISVSNNSESSSGYIWKLNNNTISTDITPGNITLNESGYNSLSLITNDENNCYDTIIELLYAYPEPEINLRYNNTGICVDDIVTIDVATNSSNIIEWNPDSGIIDTSNYSIIVSPEFTTKYVAKVTDGNGCINKDSVIVFVHPIPVVTRIPVDDTTISIGQTISLIVNTSSTVNYSWLPDESISCLKCNNPEVNPEKDITYFLTITDQCYELTEEFNITVIKDYTLVVADAFTPNDDGDNDRIYVQGKNIAQLIEFKIYNRLGNMVFSTDDINEGWDGTYQGKKLKADNYSYFVRAYTNHNHEVFLKGTFMLIE